MCVAGLALSGELTLVTFSLLRGGQLQEEILCEKQNFDWLLGGKLVAIVALALCLMVQLGE